MGKSMVVKCNISFYRVFGINSSTIDKMIRQIKGNELMTSAPSLHSVPSDVAPDLSTQECKMNGSNNFHILV